MSFIEDYRVAGGKQLGQALVAQHDISEKEVMIDDHNIRRQCLLARLHDKTFLVMWAFGTETIVTRGRYVLPDGSIFRHLAQAALVATFGDIGVAFDELEILDLFAANKAGPPFLQRSLQMIMANVIRPAFQQRHGNRRLQRRAHGRNITIEQLVLQGLGAGGDDDFPATQQRGNEVGKCFAGAGAGFRDQDRICRDGFGNRLRHLQLLRARTVPGHCARQRALGRKERIDIGHGQGRKTAAMITQCPAKRTAYAPACICA